MRLPREFADRVRSQSDIIQIVSGYVALKKRGANYLALCPFHHEKTPSFHVHPGKQIFKCFGCGLGGDVFKFVMEIEGYGFPEAVRSVAERNGIPIPREVEPVGDLIDQEQKQRERRERLLLMNRMAHEFFQKQLAAAEGQRALSYLSRRGVSQETVRQIGLGYAPEEWEALSGYLRRQRISEEHIRRSGLVVPRSDGQGHYDRFRGRVVFPIADVQGRIIAFGGRALEEKAESVGPKYLNSPETELYTKGRHLFGLSQSKEFIRRSDCAILVEGYFDFLIPFQAGIQNVIASLGTALTEAQAMLVRRFTNKIIVNFDPDPAGRAAAMRSLQMLVQHGLDVRVLVLPQGEDPDSFTRRHGAEAYRQLAAQAQGYLDFVIAQATEGLDLREPRARAQAFQEVLPYVTVIPDRIERMTSGDYVAQRLALDGALVQKEIQRSAQSARDAGSPKSVQDATPRPLWTEVTNAERLLLEILLNQPEVAGRLRVELKARIDALKGAVLYPVFEEVLDCLYREEPLDYAVLARRFQSEADWLDVLERCFMASLSGDAEALYQQAQDCLLSLERRRLEYELKTLQREIEMAEQRRDSTLYNELLLRKLEISNLLANIRSDHWVEVDASPMTSS